MSVLFLVKTSTTGIYGKNKDLAALDCARGHRGEATSYTSHRWTRFLFAAKISMAITDLPKWVVL